MTETATASTGLADIPREHWLRRADEEARDANEALEQLDQAAADAALAEVTARATEAIAGELRALRLTLTAAIASHEQEPPVDTWCRLELFGHTTLYGRVREVTRFGRRFLQLTQPEVVKPPVGEGEETIHPETTKLYSPSAVYAFEEATETAVMAAVRRQHGIYLAGDADEDLPF